MISTNGKRKLEYRLTVYGVPVAQGRPRFARVGKGVRTYDPGKSKSWKESVKEQIIEQGVKYLDAPLAIGMVFYLPRPKSLPKKVKHHVKKPDIDNLGKACKDALKGIAYRDDSLIVESIVRKEYGDPPRVDILLYTLSDEEGGK
jgi:Holliday junction resolvase RusA-like endonuclease